MNDALVYYLTLRRGMEAVREWEAENGALTAEEIAEADQVLDEAGVTGLKRSPPWQG